MSELPQYALADSHRSGSPACTGKEISGREEWLHDFRNALATILAAADIARIQPRDHRNVEFSRAMGCIEDGCNRCLRLLHTMPPP